MNDAANEPCHDAERDALITAARQLDEFVLELLRQALQRDRTQLRHLLRAGEGAVEVAIASVRKVREHELHGRNPIESPLRCMHDFAMNSKKRV